LAVKYLGSSEAPYRIHSYPGVPLLTAQAFQKFVFARCLFGEGFFEPPIARIATERTADSITEADFKGMTIA
jgi:hypothetical protein